MNPPYLDLVGRPNPADLIGLPLRMVFPEIERQGYFEFLDQVYATGETFVGTEVRVQLDRRRDGTLDDVFVDMVYQPLRDAEGQIEGAIALGFDVTEQVRSRKQIEALASENALLAEEARAQAQAREAERDWFRQVLDVLPEGVAVADASGQVILLNGVAQTLWGAFPTDLARIGESGAVLHDDGTPCRPTRFPSSARSRMGRSSVARHSGYKLARTVRAERCWSTARRCMIQMARSPGRWRFSKISRPSSKPNERKTSSLALSLTI